MSGQIITAPNDRGIKVTVVEPSQDVNRQVERVIDEFEIPAGESRELKYRSATAGYRTEPMMGGVTRPANWAEPTPPQAPKPELGGPAPTTQEEVKLGEKVGKQRAQEQDNVEKTREKETKLHEDASKKSRSRTGPLPADNADPQRESRENMFRQHASAAVAPGPKTQQARTPPLQPMTIEQREENKDNPVPYQQHAQGQPVTPNPNTPGADKPQSTKGAKK